jgi:hypothetical protein
MTDQAKPAKQSPSAQRIRRAIWVVAVNLVFNSVASDAIREVAAHNNVRYYDATADLKVRFGAAPEHYYIPNDMHFNEHRLRAYSLAVAKFLATAVPGDKSD